MCLITLFKKNVFDQLHTGVQGKHHKYWQGSTTAYKKKKEKSNWHLLEKYYVHKTMVRWTRQINSCVVTSETDTAPFTPLSSNINVADGIVKPGKKKQVNSCVFESFKSKMLFLRELSLKFS